jgi:hypothetical protein
MKLAFNEYNTNTKGTYLMLLLGIILWAAYIFLPYMFNEINLQGGKQLINKPITTSSITYLGNYEQLNNSKSYDYKYAISFWVYINAEPPNESLNTGKYMSLLNYANKPNVLYKAESNSLIIIMDQSLNKDIKNNKLLEFDENDNLILYKNDNIALQKWNNFIINYSGGVLDIFLNGELVKSNVGVIPYYTLDALSTGDNNGLSGSICNVVYFKEPLSANNIYYLYNLTKYNNPPTTNTSNSSLIKENISEVYNSLNSKK